MNSIDLAAAAAAAAAVVVVVLLLLLLLLLLHRRLLLLVRHYSPMRTLTSLMDYSDSAPFLNLCFQFFSFHILINVCTQFHLLCTT